MIARSFEGETDLKAMIRLLDGFAQQGAANLPKRHGSVRGIG